MFLHLLRTENVLRFCMVSVYIFVLKELGTETKNHTADFICERSFVRVHHKLVLVLLSVSVTLFVEAL